MLTSRRTFSSVPSGMIRNRRQRRRARKSGLTGLEGPSSSASVYRGPTKLPSGLAGTDTTVNQFTYVAQAASSAGGTIATVISESGLALTTGWASWVARFQQFRVLSMQVEFFPRNRYSKATTTTVPIYAVIDRKNNSALSSAGQAVQYASYRVLSLEDPWSDRRDFVSSKCMPLIAAMDGELESEFQPGSASPTGVRFIKLWGDSLSASTIYGDLVITYIVQCRGAF